MDAAYTAASTVGDSVEVPGTSGSLEASHSQSIPMDEVDSNMRALDVRDVANLSVAEQAEVRHGKLVVSACNADIESRECARDDIFDAMIDGGCNYEFGT